MTCFCCSLQCKQSGESLYVLRGHTVEQDTDHGSVPTNSGRLQILFAILSKRHRSECETQCTHHNWKLFHRNSCLRRRSIKLGPQSQPMCPCPLRYTHGSPTLTHAPQ